MPHKPFKNKYFKTPSSSTNQGARTGSTSDANASSSSRELSDSNREQNKSSPYQAYIFYPSPLTPVIEKINDPNLTKHEHDRATQALSEAWEEMMLSAACRKYQQNLTCPTCGESPSIVRDPHAPSMEIDYKFDLGMLELRKWKPGVTDATEVERSGVRCAASGRPVSGTRPEVWISGIAGNIKEMRESLKDNPNTPKASQREVQEKPRKEDN